MDNFDRKPTLNWHKEKREVWRVVLAPGTESQFSNSVVRTWSLSISWSRILLCWLHMLAFFYVPCENFRKFWLLPLEQLNDYNHSPYPLRFHIMRKNKHVFPVGSWQNQRIHLNWVHLVYVPIPLQSLECDGPVCLGLLTSPAGCVGNEESAVSSLCTKSGKG